MTLQPAGTEVDYVVTYLQMDARPDWGWPHLPAGSGAALLKAETPPNWYFLSLYVAVGRHYVWEDKHAAAPEALGAWLRSDAMSLYTLIEHGWPQGFFMLEQLDDGTTDLAFFGLVPEAVGKGLGTWLLKTAILTGWDMPGTERLSVNTCTLDHPRALAHYQRHGFAPIRRASRTRVLARDRDLSLIPS